MATRNGTVTRWLQAWRRGDSSAPDRALQLMYDELHHRAAGYLRRERRDHTLTPTALVHEAYLRLAGQRDVAWQNRSQFHALASQSMRRILVDHARARLAAKRPSPHLRLDIDDQGLGDRLSTPGQPHVEVLAVDRALHELARVDARQAQIVELRYFGGLSEQETADAMQISRSTVSREWQMARAWLYRHFGGGFGEPTAIPRRGTRHDGW